MHFLRLVALSLVASTVVYVCVSWYVRSVRRERLEKEWDAANPGGNQEIREAKVNASVEEFTRSLPYRALWLIYIVPIVGIAYAIILPLWN